MMSCDRCGRDQTLEQLEGINVADQGIDEFVVTANIDFFEGYGLGGNDIWVFESDIASNG